MAARKTIERGKSEGKQTVVMSLILVRLFSSHDSVGFYEYYSRTGGYYGTADYLMLNLQVR